MHSTSKIFLYQRLENTLDGFFLEITDNSDRIAGDLPSFFRLHDKRRIHYVAALCHISQDQRKPKLRFKMC